jgi:geranylgeranyl pyrophosphate synthase
LTSALDLSSLLQPIRAQLDAVDIRLGAVLDRADEPIRSALAPLLDGGKRLRPAVVLLIAKLYNRETAPFERLAAAVEMLHTATLIHDDVIDEAQLRRGRPTLHTTWSAGPAVLAGDYLLAEAVSTTATLGIPRIVHILADTLRAMCAGEIKQSLQRQPPTHLREAYYESIQAKSASLFAAAVEMAGVLAEADEAQVAGLRTFGWELGTAFQMVDDMLDLTGAPTELGKDPGADLRQGVITLPILAYLELADDRTPVQSVLSGRRDQEQVSAAIQAVLDSGAMEAAAEEVCAHVARGRVALHTLPDNAWRHILDSLLAFVVERRS